MSNRSPRPRAAKKVRAITFVPAVDGSKFVRREVAQNAVIDLTNRLHAVESVLRDCIRDPGGLFSLGVQFWRAESHSAAEDAAVQHMRDLVARAEKVLSRSR